MKKKTRIIPLILTLSAVLIGSGASAALEPNSVKEALPKKTENYLKEGVISGGDREVHSGLIKNIRRAMNGGFERIVVDIDSERTPYYQVALEPEQRRVLITVFGGPKVGLNAKKTAEDFKKSPLVSDVELFPKLEDDSWTFALHLRAATPVEVFELSAPTRIILDLKKMMTTVKATKPAKPVVKATRQSHSFPARKSMEPEDEGNGAAAHSEDLPE